MKNSHNKKPRKPTGTGFGLSHQHTEQKHDIQSAKLLYQTVIKQQIPITWSVDRQSTHLTKLRNKLHDPKLLDRVMQWYCSNFRDIPKLKLPTVTSCTMFVARWSWIHNRYEASELKDFVFNKDQNPSLQFALTSISQFAWDAAIKHTIPLHVQRTWDAYTELLEGIRSLQHVDPKSKNYHARYTEWANWLEGSVLDLPSHFTINWWARVWGRVRYKTDLAPGDLSFYEFRAEDLRYKLMSGAFEYFHEYGVPERAVTWLYKHIKGNKDAKSKR